MRNLLITEIRLSIVACFRVVFDFDIMNGKLITGAKLSTSHRYSIAAAST